MFRTSSNVARLAYQLVPAALITSVGVLLLSNLAKAPSAAPDVAIMAAPINAEAVFKITPREVSAEAQEQTARRAKTAVKLPPRKPVAEAAASAPPPPLQIVQIAEQPQTAAITADNENFVMSKLRSATATVQRIPQWAANSVTGWFAEAAPPRPPASVPVPDAQTAM